MRRGRDMYQLSRHVLFESKDDLNPFFEFEMTPIADVTCLEP